MTHSFFTCPAELVAHFGLSFLSGAKLVILGLLSLAELETELLAHFSTFESPSWASGILGVVFISGSGLVTYSGLFGIAEFVTELVAHLEFGTH